MNFRSGVLTAGEIILEINGVHVAGYTQTDGIGLIRDSGNALRITSVQAGVCHEIKNLGDPPTANISADLVDRSMMFATFLASTDDSIPAFYNHITHFLPHPSSFNSS